MEEERKLGMKEEMGEERCKGGIEDRGGRKKGRKGVK